MYTCVHSLVQTRTYTHIYARTYVHTVCATYFFFFFSLPLPRCLLFTPNYEHIIHRHQFEALKKGNSFSIFESDDLKPVFTSGHCVCRKRVSWEWCMSYTYIISLYIHNLHTHCVCRERSWEWCMSYTSNAGIF